MVIHSPNALERGFRGFRGWNRAGELGFGNFWPGDFFTFFFFFWGGGGGF